MRFLNRQPSEIMLEIAQRMRQKRRAMGYTQQELSERSLIPLSTLKRFEQKGEISLKSLLILAQVLDALDDFDALFVNHNAVDKEIEKLFRDANK